MTDLRGVLPSRRVDPPVLDEPTSEVPLIRPPATTSDPAAPSAPATEPTADSAADPEEEAAGTAAGPAAPAAPQAGAPQAGAPETAADAGTGAATDTTSEGEAGMETQPAAEVGRGSSADRDPPSPTPVAQEAVLASTAGPFAAASASAPPASAPPVTAGPGATSSVAAAGSTPGTSEIAKMSWAPTPPARSALTGTQTADPDPADPAPAYLAPSYPPAYPAGAASTGAASTGAKPVEPEPAGADGPEVVDAAAGAGRTDGDDPQTPVAGSAIEPDGARGPGDLAESAIALWSDEAAERLRDRWRDLQARFIDDPAGAVTGAKDLVTEAVQKLADTLLAAQDELDPYRETDRADTETMRVAMRRYREFLDRVLAL